MCGYNKIEGKAACGGTSRHLNDHLRSKMGFKGFVMSDWWAMQSPDAAKNGVDQEMPGGTHGGVPARFSKTSVRLADLDAMAQRVLTGMLMSGAFDETSPPRPVCIAGKNCTFLFYQAVATSDSHRAVARKVASASAVLLKNTGVLPIRKVRVTWDIRKCT